jgi:transcriptional regulator with XRE-family HTH domain
MQSTEKLSTGSTFAGRLKRLRAEKSWTLQRLAAKLGCDRSYLSRLETGKAKNPSADFLRRAAAVLGVNEQWLELGVGTPDLSPVGSELEENAQFLTAFTVLAEQMTYEQLLRCAYNFSRNPALSEGSRRFWVKMLAPWIAVKVNLAKKPDPGTPAMAKSERGRKKKRHAGDR